MGLEKEKRIRKKRRSKGGGGMSIPKIMASNGPFLYALPLIVVGIVGYALFKPDPNVIRDDEDAKMAEFIKTYSSDPNSGDVEQITKSETTVIDEKNDPDQKRTIIGTIQGKDAKVELVSLSAIDRDRSPVNHKNPIIGFWRPGSGYDDVPVRIRFTRTFMCEIFVLVDRKKPDSANYNLRKLAEIPYTINYSQADSQMEWKNLGTIWSFPDFSISIDVNFVNRDGSIGKAEVGIPCQMHAIVKGQKTPPDVDDYLQINLRSQSLIGSLLAQTLDNFDIARPQNQTWERILESDWRNGVNPAKF